jgi:hypothetical protein
MKTRQTVKKVIIEIGATARAGDHGRFHLCRRYALIGCDRAAALTPMCCAVAPRWCRCETVFTYKEVVEALLKRTDIHEGLWALHVEFGLGALNAGPSEQDLKPSAIVPATAYSLSRP